MLYDNISFSISAWYYFDLRPFPATFLPSRTSHPWLVQGNKSCMSSQEHDANCSSVETLFNRGDGYGGGEQRGNLRFLDCFFSKSCSPHSFCSLSLQQELTEPFSLRPKKRDPKRDQMKLFPMTYSRRQLRYYRTWLVGLGPLTFSACNGNIILTAQFITQNHNVVPLTGSVFTFCIWNWCGQSWLMIFKNPC